MKRISTYTLALGWLMLAACSETVRNAQPEDSLPDIYPDYTGVTIPVGIAPLNFCMADESALLVDAVITDGQDDRLHGQGQETTDFDIDNWHKLIARHMGDSLQVYVSAKYEDGWHAYQPFQIYISPDTIDYGVVYRRLEPGYEVYSKMGIYERDLTTFDERALLENTQFSGCVNCHSANRANPNEFTLHIRGKHGATLLQHDGVLTAYNTATNQTLGLCVYPYWHPSGRYIAYSTNTTRQVFHACHSNRIEVYDEASDIQIYDVEKNELLLTDLLKQPQTYETFPVFSADGKSIYFCASQAIPPHSTALDSIRYNLCRIDFDPETGAFGTKIDTLIDAESNRQSISFPRPSYDGQWLCYTLSDYGQFGIWHHEADLYMLNLTTGESKPMAGANSADTESFHNWNSTSKWMVLSSRRDDGLYTRLYFCHIDSCGQASKAFMLPQQNPRQYYRNLFFSYNVPEFVTAPTDFDSRDAEQKINSQYRKDFKVRE